MTTSLSHETSIVGPTVRHPYFGRAAALATMHRKDEAIAPHFKRELGMEIVLPAGLDTDALGTFTGEIERTGTMLDVAVRKARLAMDISGHNIGIASEGSFARDPQLIVVPAGMELMVLVDDDRGLTVSESLITLSTNFASTLAQRGENIDDFLRAVLFPSHAVIVRANHPRNICLEKGIVERDVLDNAVSRAASASFDGMARIETDMRAHMNPTRMSALSELATRLALRLQRLCPRCGAPGYGIDEVRRGLPCGTCGTPTHLVSAEVLRCGPCQHEGVRPPAHGLETAPALHCPCCNP